VSNDTGLLPTNDVKYATAAAHPEALLRVLSKVAYADDCWMWQGAKNASGYAIATVNRQAVYVHRLTFWIVKGPVPNGWVVDHLCRTPSCVNPLHLEAVLTAENTRRGTGNSRKTHCPAGHPYDASNTSVHVDTRGYQRRNCKACRDARNKAWRRTHSPE